MAPLPPRSDAAELDVPLPLEGHRYTRGELIGEGGMGQVQQVDDLLLGRLVARKVMQPELANAQGVRRFLREARIQGQLDHPAVVPVYDLGLDEQGLPWFTMQQVRGLTLHGVLAGLSGGDEELQRRFPRRRLLTAFVQVCRAIDYAHSRAVLHRDLKPANIMLGEFGDVHVLDWGLARRDGEAGEELPPSAPNREGSVFGTAGYMSPEQARKEDVDQRADVYSLGAILFEVLALRPMFEGTPEERLAGAAGEDAGGPATRFPGADVPPELDAAVVQATRRDRSQRTATARELAESVERYLDGDRDLALRRALAATHLGNAGPLVEGLDTATTQQRELAMHEVNNALALDPGNALGLELLRRLLTHMPRELPPEVEASRRKAEGEASAGVARTVSLRMAMWLALVPLVWAMGPLNVPLAASVVTSVVFTFLVAWWAGRRGRLSAVGIGLVLAASALPLLGASLILGAFVLVPALASTGMVLAASHLRPAARTPVILIGVLVVLGPFALGELGLIQPAYLFVGDEVRILPNVVHFPPGLTRALLVVATTTTLALPSLLAGRLRDRLALAEQRLLVTAWHLERLGRQAPPEARATRPPSPLAATPSPTLVDSTP